jgi:glycosyltransferase involved in cell wall biosynthesis
VKIAVLVNSLARAGGIAKHALRSSSEFASMGHDVTVWTIEYDRDACYPDLARSLDVRMMRPPGRIIAAPPRKLLGTGIAHYLWDLWQVYLDQRRLSQAMPAGYDVVHPHGNQIVWAAAAYRRRHGAVAVWMCNDFWPIASHRKPSSPTARSQAAYAAKKTITYPFERHDRSSIRALDSIVVLSEQVRSQMAAHYGVNPVIVRAGVDGWKFVQGDGNRIRARYGVSDGSYLLLTLCELMPRRRIEDVVGAVRVLADEGADVRYLVAGRDSSYPDYSRFLRAEVRRQGLEDHVIFTGEVAEQELPDFFHASDAFIWASDENQSWGLAGMEAMAAGKPLIVSRANGLAEVLEHGRTAMLVDPRSPEAISDTVRHLMAEPAFAREVAERGQRLVMQSYSWRANTESMLELFSRTPRAPRLTEQPTMEPASRR